MLQHFEDLMNANKMDARTLKATLGEVNAWVQTYAHPAQTGGMIQNVPPAPPRNATGLENMSTQDLLNALGKP